MTETKHTLGFEKCGVFLDLKEETKGQLAPLLDLGAIDTGNGTALGAALYIPRTAEELGAMEQEFSADASDEEKARKAIEVLSSGTLLFMVLGFNAKHTLETAKSAVNPTGKTEYRDPVKISEMDGFQYYLFMPADASGDTAKRIAAFPEAMGKEYRNLQDDIYENPGWFTLKPQKISDELTMPGTKVSFALEDFGGRKYTSAELLAGAEITVTDVWRTWCHFCIEEFPDLEAIQSEYGARGVQVITVCDDAKDAELKAKAEELAKPYGFRTFVKSDSFNQALRWSGTPTAYFLDKEGRVLDYPVIGKNPAALREKLAALLDGKESSVKQDEVKTDGKNAVYTVFVKDQYGTPVAGVKLGFCSDSLCNAVDTDPDGKAVFEGSPFAWHLQVLRGPAGYAKSFEEDVYTEETSGSLSLTLPKL